jgi:uncharacterized damage-inducible protein DinB
MPLVDAVLPEFDHEMTTTRKVLERVPEDRLDWKPHSKSYALGELATHLANLPTWGSETLLKSDFDITGRPSLAAFPSTRELLAAFDRNVAAMRSALSGKTDAELLAIWSLKRDGKTVFSMPKTTVLRSFVLSHMIHHRAQLGVYLRLLDIPVPSIYGPSADEPSF